VAHDAQFKGGHDAQFKGAMMPNLKEP